MTGTAWAIAKYALALAGIALVIGAERLGRPWLGNVGLGILVLAFLLRFAQRRLQASREAGPQAGGQ